MLSLNRFRKVRRVVVDLKRFYLTKVWKMDIDPTADFSLSARFDTTHPAGIHVGAESYVAFGAVLLTHDTTRRTYRHTRVGNRCFIGARSIIMPGVSVGNDCIVGTGSVVTKDVPPGSVVAGNPAIIVRKISDYGEAITRLDPYGRIPGVHG